MRLKLGAYELSIGNPSLGGIHWWISLERYRKTCISAGQQLYSVTTLFRLQYHDVLPNYANPCGGREWLRVV